MTDKRDLRIIYMGTPQFAVEPLRALLKEGYTISAVVTTPDKPAGRGQQLSQSAVKQFAISNGLKVLQPQNLKDNSFVYELSSLKPHIMVVVAFRMLPEVVWTIPSLGTFNLHASLLPNYRGAAPINWAVINGEVLTGVTTFLIDHQIDTGNILLRQEVKIDPNETAGELHDKLLPIGAQLVVKTVEQLASGNVKPIPQVHLIDKGQVPKLAPKLFKETIKIDWSRDASSIFNFIRGLSPYPAAWSKLVDANGNEQSVKIFKVRIVQNTTTHSEVGVINTDGKTFMNVNCGEGELSIEELQLAGKKNLPVKDFLLGFRGIESYRFI